MRTEAAKRPGSIRVQPPAVEDSPLGPERVRVSARVSYSESDEDSEDLWFDFPAPDKGQPSPTGDPWLVALLPLAATLGRSLAVEASVDGSLLENLSDVQGIWGSWYPHLRPVEVRCPRTTPPAGEGPPRLGAFFSGGVDSFFTLLRDRDEPSRPRPSPVEELVTIWGFDIPLSNPDAFGRLAARFEALAADLGLAFLPVATNLRDTRWREVPWGPLGHGCALAAAGHALGPRPRTLLIPATGGYRDLHPWGSHPLTDPLLSSSRVTFVHDGAAARRIEKLALLVSSPHALGQLRVCWRDGSDRNCGRCTKCLRTMIGLELLEALGQAATFESRVVPLRVARHLFCRWPWDYRELRDLVELAVTRNRPDLARALRATMAGSRRRAGTLAVLRSVGLDPSRSRVGKGLEDRLLRGWIR